MRHSRRPTRRCRCGARCPIPQYTAAETGRPTRHHRPHRERRVGRTSASGSRRSARSSTRSSISGPPALIGAAVDVIVQQENSFLARWGVVDVWHQLLLLSAITFVVWTSSRSSSTPTRCSGATSRRRSSTTCGRRVRAPAGLELAYYEERSTGGLMSVLSDDINQLERFLDIGANEMLQVVTTVVGDRRRLPRPRALVAWMASCRCRSWSGARSGSRSGWRPTTRRCASGWARSERPAGEQPRRDHHDQGVHRRGARDGAGAARERGVPQSNRARSASARPSCR
jgi:hypothetical protein